MQKNSRDSGDEIAVNRTNELNRGGGDTPLVCKDYSISAVRLVAFVFIVSCHFLQYFNNELAWWFNIGVQMFLAISGYLYGNKYCYKTVDCSLFYKTRIIKILLPYYIVLLPALAFHIVFIRDLSKVKILKTIICNVTIRGGEHLWFIATILMCYAITPLITALLNRTSRKQFFAVVGIFILSLILFFEFFNNFYNSAWIVCYILGFVLGVIEKKEIISQKYVYSIVFVLSLQNLLQVANNYSCHIVDINNPIYMTWSDFNHVWLGLLLFLVIRLCFSRIRMNNNRIVLAILDFSDKYSYECFLVHQFMILGPLSLMEITGIYGLNIVIVILLIVVFAVIVKAIENLILRVFKSRSFV